jgi:hypothetical protein
MHKSTCLDTAQTLELKRRQRQERWQQRMTHAATNAAQNDAAGRRLSKASSGGGRTRPSLLLPLLLQMCPA